MDTYRRIDRSAGFPVSVLSEGFVMKRCIISLALILSVAGISDAKSKDYNESCKVADQKVAALINQYKELRARRRQLPKGNFDKEVSGSGGGLYRVLSSLGAELGHPPYTKKIIVGCLGEPDAMRSEEQMSKFLEIYRRELRKAGRKIEDGRDRKYLIYFWRGWHDFLFFISEGGVIVDHGWWFAYE